jgi:hypothetical protein
VETLLSSGPDVLVMRRRIGQSQLIVVHGGSFLMNMPLVNHEHRKLADHLISQVGADRKVVFLDSFGAPTVMDKEPEATIPTVFALFGTSPFDVILLHLIVVGMIFCLWRFPLFGLPKRLPRVSNSDFGQHVAALGELLAYTGDRAYAEARLKQYRDSEHGEGAKPRPVAAPPKPPATAPTDPLVAPTDLLVASAVTRTEQPPEGNADTLPEQPSSEAPPSDAHTSDAHPSDPPSDESSSPSQQP